MDSIEWSDGSVVIVGGHPSPGRKRYRVCRDYQEVSEAIHSETIRDSSSLGIAAAMGIALGAQKSLAETVEEFDGEFETICVAMLAARPENESVAPVVGQLRSTYKKYRSEGLLIVRIALVIEALVLQAEESAAGRNDPCLSDGRVQPSFREAGAGGRS